MKYAVWFARLLFATWMIPAGLNHFVPLFPQPMGSQPLSHELIVALIDSHLFDIVKAVELIAGISVLTGLYTPLALILCMPVSFCVFFWDAPLGQPQDVVLIFGRETGGLPAELHERYRDRFVTMPIASPLVRSLNLSTSVGIAVYELLRQRASGSRTS